MAGKDKDSAFDCIRLRMKGKAGELLLPATGAGVDRCLFPLSGC
jgi:hypothetical protein